MSFLRSSLPISFKMVIMVVMEDEVFRKFAKISFRFCIAISVMLVVYLVVWTYILGRQATPWFMFFMGIASLLYVPKLHLEVMEKEKRNPRTIDSIGKKSCFTFFFLGCLLILGALYVLFIR